MEWTTGWDSVIPVLALMNTYGVTPPPPTFAGNDVPGDKLAEERKGYGFNVQETFKNV